MGIRAKLRPLERAAFFKGYQEKKLKNLVTAWQRRLRQRGDPARGFVVAGGIRYVYGSYPDIDGLFREQAAELDRKRREAPLHRIQQLMHERAMFAPILEPAFITRRRPARGGVGLGLITGCTFSSPYEDLRLVSRRGRGR